MKQVTLVSLYGQKRKELAEFAQRCTDIIATSPLRRVFRPYRLEQIHGTLVGMEKLVGYSDHYNANQWAKSNYQRVLMNFGPLFGIVRQHFPLAFQFGGFPKVFTQFDSFGRSPYERSFQVQWASNRVTVIGWPHRNGDFTGTRLLARFRDDVACKCGIRHKYDNDNDLFMVLGEIADLTSFTDDEVATLNHESKQVEDAVRDSLQDHKTEMTVEPDDVLVVQYEKETLPLDTTIAYRITDAGLNAAMISGLY
ncbi:MAG: hypothetical protein LAQ69_12940 [Acidobacteriia bacterium]|nr:hypothetical protein [Terriglobia bacterium]